jgi:hypothetical protein
MTAVLGDDDLRGFACCYNSGANFLLVIPAHSRSKNGVASLAYVAGHPRLASAAERKTWMPGLRPPKGYDISG